MVYDLDSEVSIACLLTMTWTVGGPPFPRTVLSVWQFKALISEGGVYMCDIYVYMCILVAFCCCESADWNQLGGQEDLFGLCFMIQSWISGQEPRGKTWSRDHRAMWLPGLLPMASSACLLLSLLLLSSSLLPFSSETGSFYVALVVLELTVETRRAS